MAEIEIRRCRERAARAAGSILPAAYLPAALLLAALVPLLAAGCNTGPRAPVSDVPYMILYEESWEELKSLSDRVDRIFRAYAALFQVDEEDLPQLIINVEPGRQPGEKGSDEFPALYRSDPPRIVFRQPPDTSLLLHEIAHHFLLARRGAFPAVSLNEGLATSLGWSALGPENVLPGQIAVEHCRVAGEAARGGRLVPLARFATMGAGEFYRQDRKKEHYSQAWALVHYLFTEHLPPAMPFHEKCDALCEMTPAELGALDEPFAAFWRDFPVRDALTGGLRSEDTLQACSAAFRLGLLQDGAAAPDLLAVARDRLRAPLLREVALCSLGIIFLGSDGAEIHVDFVRLLKALDHDRSPEVKRTAGRLRAAVEAGDVAAIQTLFGRKGCNSDFYPAGGFRVTRE